MEPILNEIVSKLDKFIKRYLWFKVLKGIFLAIGLIVIFVITLSIFEFYSYYSINTRTVLFVSYFLLTGALFIYFILIPLLSIFKIGKRISYTEAAGLIGQHFPQIKDKLSNTLELSALIYSSNFDKNLVIASINKRTLELSPFPFQVVIRFRNVKKYFLFFSISMFVLLLILAFSPGIFTKGTMRIIHYSDYFEPEAPFKFEIINKNLNCEKGKDFVLKVKLSGEYYPEIVYMKMGNNSFLLSKEKNLPVYQFVVRNVNNNIDFQLSADNYLSKVFTINVLPAPRLKSFFIDVVPPAYVGSAPVRIQNTGDINVPFGSSVTWNYFTSNVDYISFVSENDTNVLPLKDGNYIFKKLVKVPSHYSVKFGNKYFSSVDSIQYSINVIPDNFPEIELRMVEDSLVKGAYYFLILIKDDYGFSDLNFVLRKINGDSLLSIDYSKIPFNKNLKEQDVFHYIDFTRFELNTDESFLEYYFEISDNDYISSYKKSRSALKVFKPFSKKDVRDDIENSEKLSEKALFKSKSLTKEIEKEIEDFKKKELSNELSEYDKQNYLKNVLQKQKGLDDFINELQEEFKKQNQLDNQFYEKSEETLEKQKQIKELMDQILDDELKQLMEEIRKMTEKFDENQFEQIKDKIDFSYKNLEKKLDRTLELLKRYQVEDNLTRLSNDLKELSDKQEKLSEEKINKKSEEKLLEDQVKLEEEFKEIEEKFKETANKNEELKNPYEIDNLDKSFDELSKDLDLVKKEISSGSKKKSQEQQKDIAKQMEKIASDIEKMFEEMSMESNEENLSDLRQLIDNLSIFSFGQEDVYKLLNKNLANSGEFPDIISKQNKLRGDFSQVYDSLYSLASRIPIIGQNIIKESELIKYNLESTVSQIEDRKRREVLSKQRLIMNSTNTLALYLEELLKQLKAPQNGSGSASGKSKSGEQEMQSLKKQQEKLKQQLQKLLDEMKQNGGKPDGSKVGEEIVKTLAEQEIFNKMLKDLQNSKGINPETDKKLKEIKNLSDRNIDDLINKKISPELFNRNQKILSRLLEAEKAEKEREEEMKRESKEGRKEEEVIPLELKDALKKNEKFIESVQKNNLNLRKYYQNLHDYYFRNIDK